MSYMTFQQQCEDCLNHWNAAFGLIGMMQIATPPKVCPYCGSDRLIKIADHWEIKKMKSAYEEEVCSVRKYSDAIRGDDWVWRIICDNEILGSGDTEEEAWFNAFNSKAVQYDLNKV